MLNTVVYSQKQLHVYVCVCCVFVYVLLVIKSTAFQVLGKHYTADCILSHIMFEDFI